MFKVIALPLRKMALPKALVLRRLSHSDIDREPYGYVRGSAQQGVGTRPQQTPGTPIPATATKIF
jgi:hypothetical protein